MKKWIAIIWLSSVSLTVLEQSQASVTVSHTPANKLLCSFGWEPFDGSRLYELTSRNELLEDTGRIYAQPSYDRNILQQLTETQYDMFYRQELCKVATRKAPNCIVTTQQAPRLGCSATIEYQQNGLPQKFFVEDMTWARATVLRKILEIELADPSNVCEIVNKPGVNGAICH